MEKTKALVQVCNHFSELRVFRVAQSLLKKLVSILLFKYSLDDVKITAAVY